MSKQNTYEKYVGNTFGNLTVLSVDKIYLAGDKWKSAFYVSCRCGINKKVLAADVIRKKRGILSCGCFRLDAVTKHGKCKTPEYPIWTAMRDRCKNPNNKFYDRYGGRGISICSRWDDYEIFLNDMGRRPSNKHSLDRIDNNGNYCPENCRWATIKEQAHNTSRSIILQYRGERKTMFELADEYKIGRHTLGTRLKRGWDLEKALTKKVAHKRKAPLKTL